MTYLVLARKWRPRSFETLVGQDHVVRALTHALSTQRLHHAWLFTGTRGVGKTTLARLLAKSLNCEQGITPTPCGVCRACTEIDSGRFVDYLELDAASNRGVDEMTQLLEQAVYAPNSGRYKVYMIDEVHMLTGHAFNAMLKTLEEPPPHVKFILATTDPQKIPVTVLSRCLQFNLKQMTAEAIVGHLQKVLDEEGMGFETQALRLIAQAASGSMRDALSLTDQAIAYSAGELSAEAIQGMLGTIDQRYLLRLLQALSQGNAVEVLAVADELATRGLSYSGALADLAVLLSRIAIEQRVPGAAPADDPLAADIAGLGAQLSPDLVQLFYSVAVHSRGELSLAPDEYAGFVMACLRMLALAPAGGPAAGPQPGQAAGQSQSASSSTPDAPAVPAAGPGRSPAAGETVGNAPAGSGAKPARALPHPARVAERQPPAETPPSGLAGTAPLSDGHAADDIPAWEDPPADESAGRSKPHDGHGRRDDGEAFETMAAGSDGGDEAAFMAHRPDEEDFETLASLPDEEGFEPLAVLPDDAPLPAFGPARKKRRAARLDDMNPSAWPALAAQLPLTGLAAQLARQSEWLGAEGDEIRLRVAVRSLAEIQGRARLCTVLSEHFGTVVRLAIEYGATGDGTAHAVAQARQAERQREAELAVQADPFVQALINDFGASVVPGSVRAAQAERAA